MPSRRAALIVSALAAATAAAPMARTQARTNPSEARSRNAGDPSEARSRSVADPSEARSRSVAAPGGARTTAAGDAGAAPSRALVVHESVRTDSPSVADAGVLVSERDGGAKTFRFTETDVEGRLRAPELVYFLRRVRAEFAAGDLGHRSFLRELSETRRDSHF
jgi:Ni/Co efflux regulator RcnB